MKLDVILRTCQRSKFDSNLKVNEPQFVRICGDNREEMVFRCLLSLINTINRANFDIKFTVLDDNSDSEFIKKLKLLLARCNKPTELVQLEQTGPNNSAFEQFYRASQCEDLVYSVEDDYLHEPDALMYMVSAYNYFKIRYNQETVIFPFDCPFRYAEGREEKTVLYHDGMRYWRQTWHTTNTFLASSKQLREDFEPYELLAKTYPSVMEDDTINKLYYNVDNDSGHVRCYNPIPSCAYHLSYQEPNTINVPQLSWRHLWDSNHYLHMFEGWFNYHDFYEVVAPKLQDDSLVIEVGSWLGKSTIGMANINRRFNKNIKIYAIDTWEGSEEPKHYETLSDLEKINSTPLDEFMLNIDVYGVKDDIIPMQNTSEEASKFFDDGCADLIIIDAAHDYDNVYNDIKHWLPKVKKGGILAGDDFDETWPGVMAAVRDYFGEGNFSVMNNTWYKVIE